MHDGPLTGTPTVPGGPATGGGHGAGTERRPLLSSEERAAAFAAGAPKIPRRTVIILLSACLVLGLGGIVVDHFFSGPDAVPVARPVRRADPPPLSAKGASADVAAPISAMMDLRAVSPRLAPSFSLRDQLGRSLGLAQLRRTVVVLSFFDASCDDICPVVAAELRLARARLGADARRVDFVTVNSDPLATGQPAAAPAEHVGLSAEDGGYFLTGSLAQLDRVWRLYGVTIEVQPTTGRISHTDVLYFIDPSGRLRARAVPFGDEAPNGRFSLPPRLEASWAVGIASEARALLGGRS